MYRSIKNITVVEMMTIGGGDTTTGDNMLAVSKLNFSFPDANDNSLLGKPKPYPVDIRGGLKIVLCKIDETVGFTNSTMIIK